MRKTFRFSRIASIVALCMFFAACSNDNDPQDNDPQDQPYSELDSESLAIINKHKNMRIWYGRWDWEGPTLRPDFIFYSDGTCDMVTKSLNNPPEYINGVWSYDPDSKLLSTTCNDWAWNVSILTPTEWSGIVVNGGSMSYKRSGNLDPNEELIIGKWIGTDGHDEDTELSVTFKADNEYVFTKSDSCFYGIYDLNISYSTNPQRYYCDIELSGDLSGRMDFSQLNGYNIAFSTDNKLGQNLTSYEYPSLITYNFIYSDFVE